MSETVQALVNAIKDGNAIETEQAFAAAMADKLSTKLDDMRANIAASMFNQPALAEEEFDLTQEEVDAVYAISEEEFDGLEEDDQVVIAESEKWIQSAIKKPGALHAQMHVPADKKIPADKLAAAAKKGGKLGKRARLAQTLKKLGK